MNGNKVLVFAPGKIGSQGPRRRQSIPIQYGASLCLDPTTLPLLDGSTDENHLQLSPTSPRTTFRFNPQGIMYLKAIQTVDSVTIPDPAQP